MPPVIAASWDTGTYLGSKIVPGGFYVTNASGSIYYYNPNQGFWQLQGSALLVVPTKSGGFVALGSATSAIGSSIYYNHLNTDTWTQEPGAGVGLSTKERLTAESVALVVQRYAAAAGLDPALLTADTHCAPGSRRRPPPASVSERAIG